LVRASRKARLVRVSAMALASLPLVLAGEVAERYLYFSAVVPLKMPGGIRA